MARELHDQVKQFILGLDDEALAEYAQAGPTQYWHHPETRGEV